MGSPAFADPAEALRFVRSIESPYWASSIFPSEMAYFLSACDRAKVECIIESGRLEGYSTAILAAYGERAGIRVVSIDFSLGAECQQRLSRFARLELYTGDSFVVLPQLLQHERRPIALLVDGPKENAAIDLALAACDRATIAVVALHNVHGEAIWTRFSRHFPHARFLEQTETVTCALFPAFRTWERGFTRGTARDLDRTSLLVSVLPASGPVARDLEAAAPQYPRVVRQILWCWNTGVFRPRGAARAARRRLSLVGRRLRRVLAPD